MVQSWNRGHRPTPARIRIVALAASAIIFGASVAATAPGQGVLPQRADRATMFTDASDGSDWPGYGRLYDEQHFSPLTQINTQTVGKLGLAWYVDLPTVNNPATAPLEVGGTVYISYGYSVVYAIDAVTGEQLWTYDPRVTDVAGDKLKPAWGIRGMAYWQGQVFTATQDGRLIALNARTGKLNWSVMTTGADDGRYITGAPRVFNGKIIIGNGGADFAQIRGYVTAYDADSGKQLWRFFTVPGNPADGFEDPALAMAAKTWNGQWWRYGGGGTVWNAMTYDPKYNRIYIGTGNGMPWNQKIRSPGGGDNLFLCSVVALDADTGKYIWHYQTNPGETWDYNSAMDMTLADLVIDGKPRSVIIHAPKNGFLYVIDRADGKLISAEKIVPHVSWASRIDIATGRPVENPDSHYPNGETTLWPYPGGAHNWHSQSFNPGTGILYIPTMDLPAHYSDKTVDTVHWRPLPRAQLNSGVELSMGPAPDAEGEGLLAWDPVRQRKVWSVRLPSFTNAATMATAGGLVFQGRADGQFIAYDGATGKIVWQYFAGAGINAQPISYARNGIQYVTVIAGYGGAGAMLGQASAQFGWDYRTQHRRLLTFALGATVGLPPSGPTKTLPLRQPVLQSDPALEARGAAVYGARCTFCHGGGAIAGGAAPDLRASPIPTDADAFASVVRVGALVGAGMPKFDEIPPSDVEAIRHYIRAQAQQ